MVNSLISFPATSGRPGRGGCANEWTDLAPSICLDCCTLVARTDQKLLVPTIDVVEEWGSGWKGLGGKGLDRCCCWAIFILEKG